MNQEQQQGISQPDNGQENVFEWGNYTLDKIEQDLKQSEQELEAKQIGVLPLNKLESLMDQIDDELEVTETTHKFFNKQLVQEAMQGNKQNLKAIMWDFINDELRRQKFFKALNLPEPDQRLWLKF